MPTARGSFSSLLPTHELLKVTYLIRTVFTLAPLVPTQKPYPTLVPPLLTFAMLQYIYTLAARVSTWKVRKPWSDPPSFLTEMDVPL